MRRKRMLFANFVIRNHFFANESLYFLQEAYFLPFCPASLGLLVVFVPELR